MRIIEKKILERFFKDVVNGQKTFEYRKDEDNIQQGDVIRLNEVTPAGEKTGRWVLFSAGVVLRHEDWFDIPNGYCVISLVPIRTLCEAVLGHKSYPGMVDKE